MREQLLEQGGRRCWGAEWRHREQWVNVEGVAAVVGLVAGIVSTSVVNGNAGREEISSRGKVQERVGVELSRAEPCVFSLRYRRGSFYSGPPSPSQDVAGLESVRCRRGISS